MKRIWSRIKEQWNEFWDDDEFDECKYHLSSYDKRSLLYWGFVISGFTLGICLLISGLSNKYYDRKNNEDLQKVFDTICTYLATATDDEYEEIAHLSVTIWSTASTVRTLKTSFSLFPIQRMNVGWKM